MQTPPLPDTKDMLRQQMRKRRQAVSIEQRVQAAHALAELARDCLPNLFTAEVAGYMPVGSEMNIMPIMALIAFSGGGLSLPTIVDEDQMVFRRWHYGAPLAKGKYEILAPESGEQVVPRYVLLPLLACDMEGVRLGAGGGYYDRTLARPEYRGCTLLGVGYHFQLLPRLPSEPHDVRVRGFISEHGLQEFRRG